MTNFDIHPHENNAADIDRDLPEIKRDPRYDREPQADLHAAIDLAYAFAAQIKTLHPLAERQIKAMIFQGNLL